MIPERMAARSAIPTVPMIHFFFLSFAVIYGLKSSVPGMIQAFVCPTQYSSIKKTVDQIHNEQDHKALPETFKEASCAVDHVHANQHIDQIPGKTQASET